MLAGVGVHSCDGLWKLQVDEGLPDGKTNVVYLGQRKLCKNQNVNLKVPAKLVIENAQFLSINDITIQTLDDAEHSLLDILSIIFSNKKRSSSLT